MVSFTKVCKAFFIAWAVPLAKSAGASPLNDVYDGGNTLQPFGRANAASRHLASLPAPADVPTSVVMHPSQVVRASVPANGNLTVSFAPLPDGETWDLEDSTLPNWLNTDARSTDSNFTLEFHLPYSAAGASCFLKATRNATLMVQVTNEDGSTSGYPVVEQLYGGSVDELDVNVTLGTPFQLRLIPYPEPGSYSIEDDMPEPGISSSSDSSGCQPCDEVPQCAPTALTYSTTNATVGDRYAINVTFNPNLGFFSNPLAVPRSTNIAVQITEPND